MDITKIKKYLSCHESTKNVKVLETKVSGRYKLKIDIIIIGYLTIDNNKITSLLLTFERSKDPLRKTLNNKKQLSKVLNNMIKELEKENEIKTIELNKNKYENAIFKILSSENTKIDYSNGYEVKIFNDKEAFNFSVANCYFTEEASEEYTFEFIEGSNKKKMVKVNIYTENYDNFIKEFNKEVKKLINK